MSQTRCRPCPPSHRGMDQRETQELPPQVGTRLCTARCPSWGRTSGHNGIPGLRGESPEALGLISLSGLCLCLTLVATAHVSVFPLRVSQPPLNFQPSELLEAEKEEEGFWHVCANPFLFTSIFPWSEHTMHRATAAQGWMVPSLT